MAVCSRSGWRPSAASTGSRSGSRRSVDCATHRLQGWAFQRAKGNFGSPRAETACAALAHAIWRSGIPDLIVTDNGGEFLNTRWEEAAVAYGFDTQPAAPYSPEQKGIVERFFRTNNDAFLSEQPYYIKGAQGVDNLLYGPPGGPCREDEFLLRQSEAFLRYNAEHRHAELSGLTPDEAWEADRSPLRLADERNLWRLMPSETRKIRDYGIRFANDHYYDYPLNDLVPAEAQIHFLRHDIRQLWVVKDGKLVCIAKRWADLPEGVRAALILRRKRDIKKTDEIRRAAHAALEGRLAEEGAAGAEEESARGVAADQLLEDLLESVGAAAAAGRRGRRGRRGGNGPRDQRRDGGGRHPRHRRPRGRGYA